MNPQVKRCKKIFAYYTNTWFNETLREIENWKQQTNTLTRQYSSRMHTVHWETACVSVSVATTWCCFEGGGRAGTQKWKSLNRSAVITTRCHQQGVGYTLPILWFMWCTYPPPVDTPPPWWKHFLPATSFAGGKNKSYRTPLGPAVHTRTLLFMRILRIWWRKNLIASVTNNSIVRDDTESEFR